MVKRYGLHIACIALLGINALFYLTLHQKFRSLSLAYTDLSSDSAIFQYIEEHENQLHYLERRIKGSELVDASRLLSEKIDSLRLSVSKLTPGQPAEYFKRTTVINRNAQSGLWLAFQKFDEVYTQYLETEIPKAKNHFQELRQNALREFSAIEAKAKASANGAKGRLPFHFGFSSNPDVKVDLEWTKKNDSIYWNENRIYLGYMTQLERVISSSRSLQAKTQLNKLADAFRAPGKLAIYGEVYDLSHISPGELASACKYLGLLKTEMETGFIELTKDLSGF
jgi:hypothetical protein